jgi:hypothetical protein
VTGYFIVEKESDEDTALAAGKAATLICEIWSGAYFIE